MEGFIKLKRMIVEGPWYKEPNTAHLFNHLLLTANHKTSNWKGLMILRGQLITSLYHLSRDTGLSVRNVRTALRHLENTNDIKIKPTHKFTLVTICTYDEYIDKESINDTEVTSYRHSSDTEVTTNNNDNNDKNVNKGKKFIRPTVEEVIFYFNKNGYTKESAERAFSYYNEGEWKDSKGNPVKNWRQKMIAVWFKPEHKINGDQVIPVFGKAGVDINNII